MFEQLKASLNEVLKVHELYESWMGFTDIECPTPGYIVWKVNDPMPGQTKLSRDQIRQVHSDVFHKIIPGSEEVN